jgi:hypothetical protein
VETIWLVSHPDSLRNQSLAMAAEDLRRVELIDLGKKWA